jgi:hypothetical protein
VGGGSTTSCDPGQQRCLNPGEPFIQICNDDGQWAVEPCEDNGVCIGDRCLPDPNTCQQGQRDCAAPDQPIECHPGQGWVPLDACANDEVCQDGACVSRACAQAGATRSYLGCDYFATELPNSAMDPSGGTTPEAPVGVVIANPSTDHPVHLRAIGPDGQPAHLVASQLIHIPVIPGVQINERPRTVASEVRDAQGHVTAPNLAQANPVEIPPGGTATFLLPHIGQMPYDSGVRRTGFRFRTDGPVAAYQFGPYCCNYSFSNDASLLFPTTALGTSYRFLGVPSWVNPGDLSNTASPGAIAIVGTADATDVSITLPHGANIARDTTRRLRVNGNQVSATIGTGEVLLIQSGSPAGFGQAPPDLSGADISSTQPVAVFSTHMCSFYPWDQDACDHLEEQLFPTGTWGTTFSLVPPVRRNAGRESTEHIYWKIIAERPGTQVHLSLPYAQLDPQAPGYPGVPDCRSMLGQDGQTITLNGAGYCEFGTRAPVQIQGDGRLMVMGLISGQSSTGLNYPGAHAGDPSIYLVPPDLQYRDDYAFLAPDTYANVYLTVVADADTQLLLDGAPVPLMDAAGVPGGARVFKHVSITAGPHRVTGSKPFGILVFAFDDWVSYAFTGGLNLQKR